MALDMATDDYFVKPFSPTELAARTRAAYGGRWVPSRGSSRHPATGVG